MIGEILYKLPKDVPMSQYLKEKALAWLKIWLGGGTYYVPITKETKILFGVKFRKGKIDQKETGWNRIKALEDFVTHVIDSTYLQVRDTIGEEIERNLSSQIQDGLEKLYDKQLRNLIENNLPKSLPAPRKINELKND